MNGNPTSLWVKMLEMEAHSHLMVHEQAKTSEPTFLKKKKEVKLIQVKEENKKKH